MNRSSLILLALITLSLSIYAQSQNLSLESQIKVSSKVANLRVNGLYNYPKRTATLSDFYSKKPLIIAFWDVHCNTCLKSLPKLDSLKTAFDNKFTVLSVTSNTSEEVIKLFNTLPVFKHISLPYVTHDKLLTSYFSHRYLPHIIWINTQGVIVAITSEDEINSLNISNFVAAQSIAAPEKNDDLSFNNTKPYNPPSSLKQFRTVFTPYNPFIRGSEIIDAKSDSLGNITDSVTRLFVINADAISLFFKPFAALVGIDNYVLPLRSRIINNSKYYISNITSTDKDSMHKDVAWKNQNLFCFDMITSPMSRDSFFRAMMHTLNNYLPVTAGIRNQLMDCYFLVLIDSAATSLLQTTGEAPLFREKPDKATSSMLITLKNQPLSPLLDLLNVFSLNEPIIDETHLKQNVDLEISIHAKEKEWLIKYDVKSLNDELGKYGLRLEKSQKLMPVLTIDDK